MSVGKLTFLSADCDGSGAVVGSSRMVADSSGTEGAGCPGVVGGTGGAAAPARKVTSAAPDKTTPLRAIRTINRLFGIAHHSKAYCCTGAVRAVTPGQSQLRCGGGLPIGATNDMAAALFGAQWIGDWRRVHK